MGIIFVFFLCPEYLPLYVKQETVDQLFFVLNIHDYQCTFLLLWKCYVFENI